MPTDHLSSHQQFLVLTTIWTTLAGAFLLIIAANYL